MKQTQTNVPLSFRQWTRKKFSAFNSLGKVVKISVLPLTCSLLAVAPCALNAQSKKEMQLDEVEVIEEKKELYSELSRVVSIIKREEIAMLPVQNLQDLLNYFMSVDLRQRGANGVQADLSIRGGTFDQVMILLNGVNFTDPHTGHHNLNIPIDLESIERIEILQGPGSRVLGPNAFSGAINIVTGASEKSGANVMFSGGQHGYLAQSANATLKKKKASFFAAASHKQSNGYIDNTDFEITNLFLQSRLESQLLGDINIQLGYQDKSFGANSFYTALYPNQFEHTRAFLSSIKASKNIGKLNISPAIYHRRHHDRFELFRGSQNAPAWYSGHNYHQSDVSGASLNSSYVSALGKTKVGADVRLEHIYSTNLGEAMANTRPVPFEDKELNARFKRSSERKNLSWFAEHSVYLKKLSASAGVMGNINSRYGNNTFLGADVSYHFTNYFSAYGTINQSLRMPTFTDLYYVGPTNLGNPDLKPEEAITYEAGFKYIKGGFRSHIAGYQRFGRNIIDWVRATETEKWQSLNHTDVISRGMEASAEYYPKNSIIRCIKGSYSFLDMDKNSGELLSSYVLDYLRHKVVLGIDNRIYKNWGSSLRFNYQSREGRYYSHLAQQVVDFLPFGLVDLRIHWNNKTIMVFAEASNLLNDSYRDFGNIPQPGRWIRTGLTVKI
jgi:vitamin B12 transporter